jgi:hypothetical protein
MKLPWEKENPLGFGGIQGRGVESPRDFTDSIEEALDHRERP